LPIQITKIFYSLLDVHLCPQFEKCSATHAYKTNKHEKLCSVADNLSSWFWTPPPIQTNAPLFRYTQITAHLSCLQLATGKYGNDVDYVFIPVKFDTIRVTEDTSCGRT